MTTKRTERKWIHDEDDDDDDDEEGEEFEDELLLRLVRGFIYKICFYVHFVFFFVLFFSVTKWESKTISSSMA